MSVVLAEKRCWTCNETKPLSEFHRDRSSQDGHRGCCKECARRQALEAQQRQRERLGDDEFLARRREAVRRSRDRTGNAKGKQSDVVLGERYRDTVSGYEGVATAAAFYLHGCERVTLEQWIERSGELRELTFDAPRLVHLPSLKDVTTTRTGGVRPSPTRTGANR